MAESTAAAAAATAAASPASAAAPSAVALKVRTLDQKTYPIVISSDASVPQLKEMIASETGVTFSRQRLIFRGKVLKNDQQISAYALEDGHVLHLVVRANDAVVNDQQPTPTPTPAPPSTAPTPQQPTGARRTRPAAAPRSNNEPDPTIGDAPHNHVVLGATFALSDDVPMPFLSSMITNLMNSVGTAAANGELQPDDPMRAQHNREMLRRLRRSREGGTRRRARDGGDAPTGVGDQLPSSSSVLRDFADSQLRRLGSSLTDPAFAIPDIPARPVDQQGSGTLTQDDEQVARQLQQLHEHITRFGPRMERLPAALQEIAWYARQNQEAPHALVSATVRSIDSLQSIGDSSSAIARYARHVFLANSPEIPPPHLRIDERGNLRASMSFPIMGLPRPPAPLSRENRSDRQARRGGGTATSSTNRNQDDANPGVLRSIYQRVTSGLLGSRNNDNSATGNPSVSAPTSDRPARDEGELDDVDVGGFTFSAGSVPFHPIFPLSFSSGIVMPPVERRPDRPEWDVVSLWERLARDARSSTVFGILRGDPVSLYELMRSMASLFISGTYMPSLTSMAIRLWARRFVIGVRRALRNVTFPSPLLELLPGRDQTRFVEDFTRSLDPFMPELVDHIRRSNAATQGDAFGRSCTDFLRDMAAQFIDRVRAYVDDDGAHGTRLLEGILVALDVEAGLATYIISRLYEFATPLDRSRRAALDSEDTPATKRQRTEGP